MPETAYNTTRLCISRVKWALRHIDPIQFSAQVAASGESGHLVFDSVAGRDDARCGFHGPAADRPVRAARRRLTDGSRGPLRRRATPCISKRRPDRNPSSSADWVRADRGEGRRTSADAGRTRWRVKTEIEYPAAFDRSYI